MLPDRSIGTFDDVRDHEPGLAEYLRTFLEAWNEELAPDGELAWQVMSPASRAPLLAVRFVTRYKKDPSPKHSADAGTDAWRGVMAKLNSVALSNAGSSRIFVDTFFRYISDRELLFIMRNERSFWTRPSAREDS